jgi:hypothetical protein
MGAMDDCGELLSQLSAAEPVWLDDVTACCIYCYGRGDIVSSHFEHDTNCPWLKARQFLELSVTPLEHLGPEQPESTPSPFDRNSDDDLTHHLRRVTAIPADDDVVDGALRLVVALAKATIGGADGVSVSLRRHGRLATVAASDQTILDMDAGQYATGEGPCVDASVEGRWFHVEYLGDEERWPAFIPRAKKLGINAILSSPLLAEERPVGALNIYSRTAAAFAPKDQELASIFATETSIILRDAGVAISDEQLTRRIQEAMVSREIISLARGIIMGRDRCSSDDAFAALRRISQETNAPLRDCAAEIVISTQDLPLAASSDAPERGDG